MQKNQKKGTRKPTARRITPPPQRKFTIASKKDALKQINELYCNPVLLDRFNNHLLGYDLHTGGVVYDGYGIVNQLVDEAVARDLKNKEPLREWEDYYDEMMEVVSNSLQQQNSSPSILKGSRRKDQDEDMPRPHILMLFIPQK